MRLRFGAFGRGLLGLGGRSAHKTPLPPSERRGLSVGLRAGGHRAGAAGDRDVVGPMRPLAGDRDDQAYRAFNVQGRALLLLKRTDEASEAMQRCVSLKPGHAGNTLVLAEALRSAGRREQAIVYYRRVLELVPGQPTASKRLAELGG